MKIIITESQLNRLNEDITAGRMIVYHRTGKKGFNPSKNIADTGYIVSTGAAYGYGVYTTYDLESQMGDNMKNNYGPIIIESQILDTSKFLIFNYDIAKKIYKSRYRFRDQLKQILGKKEWLKYKDNSIIKNIDYRLDEGNIKYTSVLARDFYLNLEDSILQKLNGMIFTGGNDGNVLVSYNRRNIEPLRYSEDDGKTWTNIRNVKTYQRIKEPDDYRKNPEIQYLLNNIENEPDFDIDTIPSKYHEYLFNFLSKKDNSKLNDNEYELIGKIELIKKFGSYDIFEILKNSTDKKQTVIEIIEMKGDRLTSKNLHSILSYFTIPDNKSLMNIDVLIIKIIESIGKELLPFDIEYLLECSNDKDLIVAKIIDLKGNKLDYREIYHLLNSSTDKDHIATKIIDIKGKELDSQDVQYLIRFSTDKDLIATKIIDIKGVLISKYDIFRLFDYSEDKDFMATKIIKIKGEELQPYDISQLLKNSKDKELIKKLLLQNGVDYKLINKVITNLNMDIPLIPDNYQEMLNEIRRIKEIMR